MAALSKIVTCPDAAPFAIRAERPSDVAAREALLDASFGENRYARTCQRLRDNSWELVGSNFRKGACRSRKRTSESNHESIDFRVDRHTFQR